MAIDFNDPGQVTHGGAPIPINTQAKYDKGEQILKALYELAGVPWTAESAKSYENRVRQGQSMREIIENTYDEYLTRSAD